jgi:hypothetical protein
MSNATLDVSDLTEEERETLVRMVEALRRARKGEVPAKGFAQFWDKLRAARSPMSEEEADALAAEAVAHARGRL